jgi:hypothetical protein
MLRRDRQGAQKTDAAILFWRQIARGTAHPSFIRVSEEIGGNWQFGHRRSC